MKKYKTYNAKQLSIKLKLDVWKELRRRLNGKCGEYCPEKIWAEIKKQKISLAYDYFCPVCSYNFNFINSKYKDVITIYNYICPCNREPNPDELFLRLDEYIEELEQELSKQYSS